MGGFKHDPQEMERFYAQQKSAGLPAFQHDDNVRKGKARRHVHELLNPAYGGIRVSDYPDANTPVKSVIAILDVTGTNIAVARAVHPKLPDIMDFLAIKGWNGGHVNLQMGCIGDPRRGDRVGWQISQFESTGVAVATYVQQMFLEGGGHGNQIEGYDIAFWGLAHGNYLRSWQDGIKGTAIFIFDEGVYDTCKPTDLARLYMDDDATNESGLLSPNMMRHSLDAGIVLPNEEIAIDVLVADLKKKYNVYGIIGDSADNAGNQDIIGQWKGFFGAEHIMEVPTEAIIDTMIGIVGYNNGVPLKTIGKELAVLGTDKTSKAIVDALGKNAPPSTNTNIVRL